MITSPSSEGEPNVYLVATSSSSVSLISGEGETILELPALADVISLASQMGVVFAVTGDNKLHVLNGHDAEWALVGCGGTISDL